MKKLLLHTCCAPCGTSCFERLINEKEYDITSFYYNPNIRPKDEWSKRLGELEKLVELINGGTAFVGATCSRPQFSSISALSGDRMSPLQLVVSEYNPGEFEEIARGLEDEAEGGGRCENCFWLRLRKTAEHANINGFEAFGTTLTVSPHKNTDLINRIGREIGELVGIEYLERDFKKNDGYKRSIELCRELEVYRQNYCGCKIRG